MSDTFKFIMPAEIEKSKDGDWKVAGLASTSSVDRQGEIIVPSGIDATPIAKGHGFFNFDHDNSPESTIGALDGYTKTPTGLYVSGRLFKNHARAKAVYEIMSSLNKGDKGRVGMSVEGKVIERDPKNPTIIKRCLIKNVALTFSPVNQDTYADIVKSMTGSELEFDSTGKSEETPVVKSEEPTFTPTQVVAIVEKALGVGAGYAQAPGDLKGGDALAQESMDHKDKKVESKDKKKLKKSSKELVKSQMLELLDKLQALYPNNSRSEIWNAVQDRMETHFPELKVKE
jgi:hypothetical protein